ncbi:MAG: hypothetical protein M3Z26_04830 [Bacteroidota bacterium]|nr:hypothetical protein [Bacteroidota bacterium]
MTRKEVVNRNIGLTFDFIRQAVEEPALLDKIPNGFLIEFVEKDFAKKEKSGGGRKKFKIKYLRVQSTVEII